MSKFPIWSALLLFAALAVPSVLRAQWVSYETKVVGHSLNVPWEIRWGYDNWIWFTERAGRVCRLNPETGEKKVLLHVPYADHTDAEKGTLGFDFHPDFPDSPYLYIAYNHFRDAEPHFNVMSWTYLGDSLVAPEIILNGLPTGQIHNGSRVKVGPDRKLYITTGEADHRELAQDPNSLSGKVLRMNLDGSVPEDNPFPGSPIWSMGHRNPQGLCFGPTGLVYSTEHGPASDDELNLIAPGRNYGWPLVEGDCNRTIELEPCDSLDVVEPMVLWTPTVAVTGIEYNLSSNFPEWNNSLLLATLKDESLWILKLSDDGKAVKGSYRYPLVYSSDSAPVRRLRDFCFSPDGRLFVSTSNIWSAEWSPDRIIEISRVSVTPSEVHLIAPGDSSTLTSGEAQFKWADAFIEARYLVQVSSSKQFDPADIENQLETSDTTVTLSLSHEEGQYFWRVRELLSNGPWSEVSSFELRSANVADGLRSVPPNLFPNPARSFIRFNDNDLALRARIFNSEGATMRWLSTSELFEGRIQLEGMSAGRYFLCLEFDNERTRITPFVVH